MTRRRLRLGALLAAVLLPLAMSPVALAHEDEPEPALPPEETEVTEEQPHTEEPADHDETPHADEEPMGEEPPMMVMPILTLQAPAVAERGERIQVEALLVDPEGLAIPRAQVLFLAPVDWGGYLRGRVLLGTATTDQQGWAALETDLRTAGEVALTAVFRGDTHYQATEAGAVVAVSESGALALPEVGLRIPGLGVWWLLVLVAAVWGTFLLVASQVVGIARDGQSTGAGPVAPDPERTIEPDPTGRRSFLRKLLPTGLAVAVAGIGSGLITIIRRSPRTHANLTLEAPTEHRSAPVARLGVAVAARPMPPLLEREVSFTDEVLPILLEKGGPHAAPPTYSSPPHGVRLDSYQAIMGGGPPGVENEHDDEGESEDQHGTGGGGGDDHGVEDEHGVEDDHGMEDEHDDEDDGAGDPRGHPHNLVVPGKPEESLLVRVLLEPARRMPPAVGLADEEVQSIASWIAQGARDN